MVSSPRLSIPPKLRKMSKVFSWLVSEDIMKPGPKRGSTGLQNTRLVKESLTAFDERNNKKKVKGGKSSSVGHL